MNTFQYNDRTVLGYEHEPILASANVLTGTRFRTKIYLFQGKSQYPIGEVDGKLTEEDVAWKFAESIQTEQTTQYGQQGTILRKDLRPRRDGAKQGSLTQQLGHADMRGRSILNR